MAQIMVHTQLAGKHTKAPWLSCENLQVKILSLIEHTKYKLIHCTCTDFSVQK